jgi:hypothetical protein
MIKQATSAKSGNVKSKGRNTRCESRDNRKCERDGIVRDSYYFYISSSRTWWLAVALRSCGFQLNVNVGMIVVACELAQIVWSLFLDCQGRPLTGA